MPWAAGEGELNFSALCREVGVSRQVGYDWLGRYREAQHDIRVAEERSRRPLTSPSKVPEEVEDFIVAARKRHPTWGPKKLRTWIGSNNPHVVLRAPSTMARFSRAAA